MIVFPWLVLGLALVILALLLASTRSGARWLRSRGAEAFVYPSLRTVAAVLVVLAAVLAAWYLLAGPPD